MFFVAAKQDFSGLQVLGQAATASAEAVSAVPLVRRPTMVYINRRDPSNNWVWKLIRVSAKPRTPRNSRTTAGLSDHQVSSGWPLAPRGKKVIFGDRKKPSNQERKWRRGMTSAMITVSRVMRRTVW